MTSSNVLLYLTGDMRTSLKKQTTLRNKAKITTNICKQLRKTSRDSLIAGGLGIPAGDQGLGDCRSWFMQTTGFGPTNT